MSYFLKKLLSMQFLFTAQLEDESQKSKDQLSQRYMFSYQLLVYSKYHLKIDFSIKKIQN